MSVTLASIVTEARDQHPAFDKKRTSDAIVVRHLNSYQKLLQAKALQRNRRALQLTFTQALPLADFAAGITLPANVFVGGGVTTSSTGVPAPFYIIDASIRLDRAPWPSGWLEGFTTLKLVGESFDWDSIVSLAIEYVPACAELVDLTSLIALPDDSRAVFVDRAVALLTGRGHTDSNLPAIGSAQIMLARQIAQQTESDWLDNLGARNVGKVFQVQDGY